MHWGEWLAWFAPRKIDEWKKLLVAWAIDLFGGATEAESANLDPPRAKIGKLAKHVTTTHPEQIGCVQGWLENPKRREDLYLDRGYAKSLASQ